MSHHKIPLSIGGTNEYSNLILLREGCHKLVHKVNLTREEVPNYMKIKVINKYRVMCGLNKV
ncbi:HNH endonuclease [uncultured Clostridium sp.]|uniref:HNH endonuclease n=1 Tax=uncultured Clostridium sp. TaxID=59620 RepID=UPI0025D4CED3|nr:HNH endonuclease [uncultured Clostridium sp.]